MIQTSSACCRTSAVDTDVAELLAPPVVAFLQHLLAL